MNRTLIACAAAFSIFAAAGAWAAEAQTVIWLEAEHFAKAGGWANDPQFVDLMGSPYLLATGIGKPVADAVTEASVPAAGRYRLWVRAKDWLPEHSPGRFQVIVGGKASPAAFGKAKDDTWQWIDGGEFDLQAGKVEVRLHDLTGWWGRCDAVVLAAGGYAPPSASSALAQERIRCGGLPPNIDEPKPYDVVVVGGGLAGAAAAVAAARHDCRVALVQDRPVLGGNASDEIEVPIGGDQSREPFDPRETGIIEEIAGDSARVETVVRAEKNIDLYLNTRATGIRMKDPKTIAAVVAQDVTSGRRLAFSGRIFIDCTGHGWVGFWAGADFRVGREAKSEFGETLTPDSADALTMGNTLHNAKFETRAEPVPFTAPPWAYKWEKPADFETVPQGSYQSKGEWPANFLDLSKGKGRRPDDASGGLIHTWWVEYGGMVDTIHDAEKIRDELFRINIGLWNYAHNFDPKFKDANARRELVWLNHVPGTRESRRLIGDYVMSQKDYAEKIQHPDTIAYAGWTIDDHHPQGFWVKGPGAFHAYRYKVSIPYRILYSRNVDNLMMAGRDVSVTHAALGGLRVMRTTCVLGQAAGTGAAVALAHQAAPRGVYEKHIRELQQALLRDGCYLPGFRNEDPADLALAAAATASSTGRLDRAKVAAAADGSGPHGGTVHPIDVPRAVMFTAPADRIDSASVYLRSENDKPTPLKLAIRAAKQLGDFSSAADIAAAEAAVPPMSEGWVAFPLRAATEKGKLYWVRLPAAPGLKWDLYPDFPPGTSRAYADKAGGWKTMDGCYKVRLEPGGEPAQAPAAPQKPETPTQATDAIVMGPENVNNGWNRAVAGYPNAWMPDPAQPLPQWVELKFPKAARFNTVHVTFQTAAMAASAYTISVPDGQGWREALKVDGNTLRRRIHTFDAVQADRLRLTLTGTSRDGTPHICEMRVYMSGT